MDGRPMASGSRSSDSGMTTSTCFVCRWPAAREERLTSKPDYDDGPEYSPDGKWIYFNSDRSGSWDIWRMPAEGGGPNDEKAEQVTKDDLEDWFPHFSPDGKWLVFLVSEGNAGP